MRVRFPTGVVLDMCHFDFSNYLKIEMMYQAAVERSVNTRDAEKVLIKYCTDSVFDCGHYIGIREGLSSIVINFDALAIEDIIFGMDFIIENIRKVKEDEVPFYKKLRIIHRDHYKLAVELYEVCLGIREFDSSSEDFFHYTEIFNREGNISDRNKGFVLKMFVKNNFVLELVKESGMIT